MDMIWSSEKTTARLAAQMLNHWRIELENCEDEVLQDCGESLQTIINKLNSRDAKTRSWQAPPSKVNEFWYIQKG